MYSLLRNQPVNIQKSFMSAISMVDELAVEIMQQYDFVGKI
jgi:hypothetical protein